MSLSGLERDTQKLVQHGVTGHNDATSHKLLLKAVKLIVLLL